MKKTVLLIFIFMVQYCFAQQQFQLATPLLKYQSMFFTDTTSFTINFNQPGATVHYTLNGAEPKETDRVYTAPVKIKKRTVVKAKAFSNNFSASETVMATFIKDGKKISRINFSKPNEAYTSTNTEILNDNIGGNMNLKSGTWLGYNNDTVEINIELSKKQNIHAVLVNILQDEGSWIFLPAQLQVNYYDEKLKNFVPIATTIFVSDTASPKQCKAAEIPFAKKINTDKLQLLLQPLKKIPDWHAGKGNHAWLFIDETKVY
jgi:Chitobiase/beta-hexosaminidase C-terminal domain